MRKLVSLIAALAVWSAPGLAADKPVVVELFTSQGCSSCPPADAYLHELAKRDDVVALALHVDYWDYIGWKDVFADPSHTERQRGYARAGGRTMIYTPQMVINGTDHVVGNRPKDVSMLIDIHKAASADKDVAVEAKRSGGQLTVGAEPHASLKGRMTVRLVRYEPKSKVDIKRGENAGRTISYANVVTDMDVIGHWDPSKPLSLNVPIKGKQPAVVLIQRNEYGPIEASVRIN